MIKTLIIDSESDTIEKMQEMLPRFNQEMQVIGTADTVLKGVKEIQSKKPDVVFLDVSIHPGDGFDLLDCLPERDFQTVVVTREDNYAVKAIKAGAIDYLLKPIDVNELRQTVSRINRFFGRSSSAAAYASPPVDYTDMRIPITTHDGFCYTRIKDIVHLKAEGSYTQIYVSNAKPIMVSKNLKEFEHLLEDKGFIRIHNSHLINTAHVNRFIRGDGGYAIMSDNTQLEVSRNKKEHFLKAMGLCV